MVTTKRHDDWALFFVMPHVDSPVPPLEMAVGSRDIDDRYHQYDMTVVVVDLLEEMAW